MQYNPLPVLMIAAQSSPFPRRIFASAYQIFGGWKDFHTYSIPTKEREVLLAVQIIIVPCIEKSRWYGTF
jgi:hypothetical protein